MQAKLLTMLQQSEPYGNTVIIVVAVLAIYKLIQKFLNDKDQ